MRTSKVVDTEIVYAGYRISCRGCLDDGLVAGGGNLVLKNVVLKTVQLANF